MVCPICKTKTDFLIAVVKCPYKVSKPKPNYEYFKCPSCQHRFVKGRADKKLLNQIYTKTFFSSSQQSIKAQVKNRRGEIKLKGSIVDNALARISFLNKMKLKGKLLDIGSGKGYFVKLAGKYFDAIGVESSSSAIEGSQELGIKLIKADIMKDDLQHLDNYDVVTLWDVYSCLKDPYMALSRVAMCLRSQGALIMTVPKSTSFTARTLGRFWPLLIPPVSLHYYSERSIQYVLNKSNFKVKSIEYHSKNISLRFIAIKLLRTFHLGFMEPLAKIIPNNIKVRLNLRDIMTVVAEKI